MTAIRAESQAANRLGLTFKMPNGLFLLNAPEQRFPVEIPRGYQIAVRANCHGPYSRVMSLEFFWASRADIPQKYLATGRAGNKSVAIWCEGQAGDLIHMTLKTATKRPRQAVPEDNFAALTAR